VTVGQFDAITDVAGVLVGHTTLVSGDGPLRRGVGPVRTGVTVVRPHGGSLAREPLFAGFHVLNGNGEMTGLHWLAESGLLTSAIGLTNTHSVGVVRDELAAIEAEAFPDAGNRWFLPVVAETWDGVLNDIDGGHVRAEHARAAYDSAAGGAVAQGGVGGGTGMICHGFKGGIGTSSRVVDGYTVGVLVQANHGRRERFQVGGVPVGRLVGPDVVPLPPQPGAGSIVGIVATDAPLLPHQCRRLAQRAALGVARTGGAGEHASGDLFLAFSTANRGIPADLNAVPAPPVYTVAVLHNQAITALFDAVIEATEQAIVNAVVAADTMVGRDGNTAYAGGPYL
jgi:D-aminopeptidase